MKSPRSDVAIKRHEGKRNHKDKNLKRHFRMQGGEAVVVIMVVKMIIRPYKLDLR